MEKFYGVSAGVEEIERGREGVVVLMKDMWRSGAVDFGRATSKVLWVKFKFLMVKICCSSVWTY